AHAMARIVARPLARCTVQVLLQERLPEGASRLSASGRSRERGACRRRAALRPRGAGPEGDNGAIMTPVHTLGINAVFHDSAAALVRDGEIVAAAEEERFSRIKHAKRPVPFSAWELPYYAIDYCLREAGIELRDVDQVAYSFDPALLPIARSTNGAGDGIRLPLEPSARPVPAGAE